MHGIIADHCNLYLEDMERLELDGPGVVLQQDHHELQVVDVADIAHHHLHIRPVQQQLSQQLQHTDCCLKLSVLNCHSGSVPLYVVSSCGQ